MPTTANILVVANRTALSNGLGTALRARRKRGPARFTLVVPIGGTDDARRIAEHMAASLRDSGMDIEGRSGDTDPLTAVLDVWSADEYDEIIVSTLPASSSRWMASALPRRIEHATGAHVRHIEAPQVVRSGHRRRLARAS